MACHLINKAVMKQNCIEALNQHAISIIIIKDIYIAQVCKCFYFRF